MSKLRYEAPFLDDEEREDIEAFRQAVEDGTVKSELTPDRKAELMAMARATMNPPKKQISVRLSVQDLAKLKVKAMEKGIPYQTLLGSIVHQYVEGRLVEKD